MPNLQRTLTPEILDSLPEGHPDAIHNRRDLRIFNALMGNFAWLERQLKKFSQKNDSILELGAGDGGFGRQLYRKSKSIKKCTFTGLDLWSRPKNWPKSWNWQQTDIRDEDSYKGHSIVIGNMILHQFDDKDLAEIGTAVQKEARLYVFNETARSRLSLFLLPLTRLLGTNYVSNHDAKVSIESGFRGEELATLLGLDPNAWQWQAHSTSLGAYRFVARRRTLAF